MQQATLTPAVGLPLMEASTLLLTHDTAVWQLLLSAAHYMMPEGLAVLLQQQAHQIELSMCHRGAWQ